MSVITRKKYKCWENPTKEKGMEEKHNWRWQEITSLDNSHTVTKTFPCKNLHQQWKPDTITVLSKPYGQSTCSVIQAMASITRATTSERRIARNARLTDKASVVLPDEATAALLLIPAVSISRYFWTRSYHCIKFLREFGIKKAYKYKPWNASHFSINKIIVFRGIGIPLEWAWIESILVVVHYFQRHKPTWRFNNIFISTISGIVRQ